MEEVLNERKQKILKAIIKTYMETGEPVGSRTISKYADLNVSSATIRNEMSDLTDMGYIVQPHTSAGRIPSDKGYRLYVNELMKEKEAEVAELRDLIIEKTDKMDKVLKKVAKVLASNTNYATMVSVPQYSGNKIKFIQLSRMSDLQLVAVVVSDNNTVRNQIINLDEEMDDQTILKLNLLLNTNLNGIPIQDISLGMIARLKEQAGSHSGVVATVLDAVAATIHVEEEDMEIYTSGATNIFKYPELADKEKATELISAFEEKHELADLVKEQMSDGENTGIQVYIGDEMPIQTMKDCSIVTARYELGDGMYGTIGIIGPKRMDYENVVDSLKELKNHLDGVLKKKTQKGGRKTVSEETKKKSEEQEAENEIPVTDGDQAEENLTPEGEELPEEEKKTPGEDEAASVDKKEEKNKTSFFGKKKKDKSEQKVEELTDRLKRTMAEFDNFRKRTEKEKSSMYIIGAKEIVEKILPVVDNFERGLAQAQEGDAFADGMKMIYKQLTTTLDDLGVKPIEAVGKEFNPDFHNAVMHVEDEEVGENIVVEEFQKGYTYKDFVVRHSMVKVAN